MTGIEEIKARLAICNSDERKIEILEKALNETLDKETKKFVLMALAKLYEKKNMLNFALRHYVALNSIVEVYREKIPLLLKIAQLNIKQFNWQAAREAYRQALSIASSSEAKEIEQIYFNFFLNEARAWENKKRYRKAIEVYEQIVNISETKEKKIFFLNKIAELYDLASMPAEANKVRRQIELMQEQ